MAEAPTLFDVPEDATAQRITFPGGTAPASTVNGAPDEPAEGAQPSRPRARRSDPETSHQAARRVTSRAATHRQIALDALIDAGEHGLTDFELAHKVGIQQTSIGVRRHELEDRGLVVWAGTYRPSPSGSPARVWKVR